MQLKCGSINQMCE